MVQAPAFWDLGLLYVNHRIARAVMVEIGGESTVNIVEKGDAQWEKEKANGTEEMPKR